MAAMALAVLCLSSCASFRAGIRDLGNRNQIGDVAPSLAAQGEATWVGADELLEGDWYIVAFLKPS